MTTQTRYHRHAGIPSTVEISGVSIDRREPDWEMIVRHGDRNARTEFRIYIDYCPYCGKELNDEE